jgi:CubicO group peptidase (beta-lactamase class C family)
MSIGKNKHSHSGQILSSLAADGCAQAEPNLTGLNAEVDALRQEWMIPGVAVGIVKQSEVVFLEGFGLRDVERELAFTPDTLMRVASTTKSFTSALVGVLVDRGVVQWDRPVREYNPDFQMQDPFATAEMTLEDMLCHRSGLPYHENLLATGVGRVLTGSARGFRENLVRRLRFFDPSHRFRTHFQYQDIIYTAIGGILERATNRDYTALVEEHLLRPLGMQSSNFSINKARSSGLLAEGYAEVSGDIVPVDFIDLSYLAPCAGLYSTTAEMLHWVQFHLNGGRVGEEHLISRESMDWMHRAHMVVDSPDSLRSYATPELSYGQGWFRSLHNGSLMVSHGGSFNGHRTFMAFLPEFGIGGVVLCNLNLTNFPDMLLRVALDRLIGIDSAAKWDRHARGLDDFWKEKNHADFEAFLNGRHPENAPRLQIAAYAGAYTHPGYGTFVVDESGRSLNQTYEGRTFLLEPYDGETMATRFQSTENHLLNLTMTFETDTEGRVVAMTVPLIPGIAPQRFVRE